VVWSRTETLLAPEIVAAREALARARTLDDSVRALNVLATDPLLEPLALGRLAEASLAMGDTMAADSAWRRIGERPGPWQWDALRRRVDVRAARPAEALALLEAAVPAGWTSIEEAAWLLRRARLCAVLGDTVRAESLARRILHRYPATPVAVRAVADLDAWWQAQRMVWPPADELAAVDVEALAGERVAALRRLEHLRSRLDQESQWSADLRRATLLRELRRFDSALATLAQAERRIEDAHRRSPIVLERARVYRDQGAIERALRTYAEAASKAVDPSIAEQADSEAMRTAELAGRHPQALAAAIRLADREGPGGDAGAVRAGIAYLAHADLEGARAWFQRADSEEGLFWRAAVEPNRVRADSLRRLLAGRPGFGFYATAARESLGTGVVAWTITPPAERPPLAIHQASRLVALGATEDALKLLERWRASTETETTDVSPVRLPRESPGAPGLLEVPSWAGRLPQEHEPRWRQLLAAAAVCYEAGAWATGIRYAWYAYREIPEADTSDRWGVVPWLYPPAHLSLFAPGGVWSDSTALLYAVAWQESRFDSMARSRSNALGLMQLKLATAREQARMMRLPLPREQDLFRPTQNLELGAGYLKRIAETFDGRPTMALAAYNAGPSGARPWARLPDPGGEALACELITYGQTHQYVKTVLGVWQAARALRPRIE
jgi:tetratricopeptide (TPR) repeat protein